MMTIARTFRDTSITNQTFEKKAFIMLSAIIVLLVVSYAYGIISTISFVLERRSIETETKNIYATLSSKEAQYLSQMDSLTIEKATEMGFVQTKNIGYATVASSRTLTLNTR